MGGLGSRGGKGGSLGVVRVGGVRGGGLML